MLGPAAVPRVAGALVAGALLAGCAAFGAGDRGPVSLAGSDVIVLEGTTLDITVVASCDGDPELTSLVQEERAVTVEVVTTTRENGAACADVLRVELDEPLGDRDVLDAVSGEALEIAARE